MCPNGSLADMLKKRKCLTLPEIRRFMIQICGAVKYLHTRHVVHRDLKTGNLFLDANMNVQVGDFGLAALLVTEKEMEVKRRTTMCGTPNYLAPEILEKGKGHNEKVDLWSIGVITYTLAVGKAPFHASSKEEIYKKLKQGEYKWPELSATHNDISTDLRNTVASLLVPEEERPEPDDIIGQPFFRMGYVPHHIPVAAREKIPQWSEVSLPSKAARDQGFTDSWYSLCKEAGVGKLPDGTAFKLNRGRKIKSIVHDFQKEAQLGTAPVMPIPKDTVYVSTVSEWDISGTPEPEEIPTSSQQSSRGMREISNNEVAKPRTTLSSERRIARDAEMMPPPSRPASRVAARSGTVRRAARTISEEAAKAGESLKVASDPELVLPYRASRTRIATSTTTTTTLRESNTISSTGYQASQSQNTESAETKPQRNPSIKRSADASLARRPRATVKKTERPISPPVTGPYATLDELKQTSPVRRPRRKVPQAEVVEILSDPEPGEKPSAPALSLPPPPRMSKTLPRPRKVTTPSDAHPDTDPTTVLERLTAFRDNLANAISNSPSLARQTSRPDPADAENLPFVCKWVDYSVKHGVGYVLKDGTVGCVFNASAKHNTPVTHVYNHDGRRWLSKLRKDLENSEIVPLEILEDRGTEGIIHKVYKGLGSVKEGPLAAEAARRKTLSVLWAKFGRYMCQSLEGDVGMGDAKSECFVRFYQRIGNVGLWVFADGAMQVHFPDHTKLVISAAGTLVSATCISAEAAEYLRVNGDLLPHHITGREILADTVQGLLHESGRVRSKVVRANDVEVKLRFVADVVGQWIANGGLGRLDADKDINVGEKLYWEGMMVKDQARKVERVTVGRLGGDTRETERVVAAAARS
jgi:serine/threonine protein kinase